MANNLNTRYNIMNDPAVKGPGIIYKTADSTFLGPVKFSDDKLSQFIEDWIKSDETRIIPLKNFLTSKNVEETMLDSIINDISNTVFGTYGNVGRYQVNEEGESVILRGQHQPFREDLNPKETARDTTFISDREAESQSNLMDVLWHELLGHKLDIEHSEGDEEIYEELSNEMTKLMNVGDISKIMELLFAQGYSHIK
jgi:hypothetical protein